MTEELTLKLTSATEPGDFHLDRLQRELWDAMLAFCANYVSDQGDIWAYVRDVTLQGQTAGWFRSSEHEMVYDLPDHDGDSALSAAATIHWLELASVAAWKTLESVAEHHGLELAAPQRLLAEVLDEPEDRFVTIGGSLWKLGRADGTTRLVGDGIAMAASELDEVDEPDASLIRDVAQTGRCMCGMCVRLRPDPPHEGEWVDQLIRGSDQNAAERAAWFLFQSASPSDDAIIALSSNATVRNMYRHARSMFELGKKLDATRFEGLLGRFATMEDRHARAALIACIAGLPVDAARRVEVLSELIADGGIIAATAVEFLGYGTIPASLRERFAEQLTRVVGESEELDYAIALTLYNVFREESRLPREVRQAFERLASSSGDGADIATRALSWFDRG